MSLQDYGIVIDSRPNEYIHEDDYLTYEQIKAREKKRQEIILDDIDKEFPDKGKEAVITGGRASGKMTKALKRMSKLGIAGAFASSEWAKSYHDKAKEIEEAVLKLKITPEDAEKAKELCQTTSMDYITSIYQVANDKTLKEKYTEIVKTTELSTLEAFFKVINDKSLYPEVVDVPHEINPAKQKKGINCNVSGKKESDCNWDIEYKQYEPCDKYEVDPKKLEPGMMVKIKEKNNMLDGWFIGELDQKTVTIKKVDYYTDSFQVKLRNMVLNVPIKCIESIITEELETIQDKKDAATIYGNDKPKAAYTQPKQGGQIFYGNPKDLEVRFKGQKIVHTIAGSFITEEPESNGEVATCKEGPTYSFVQIADNKYQCQRCDSKIGFSKIDSHCCEKDWDNPYAQPKQVKALWLGQTEGDIPISCYDDLLKENYIGFVCKQFKSKCMIIRRGKAKGFSISDNCVYAGKTTQENIPGIYYIFKYAQDLYLWMAEGEE